MRRSGIGLKPIIALDLALILSVSALLIGYASFRLLRHSLILENVQLAKAWLSDKGPEISRVCPDVWEERRCQGLSSLLPEKGPGSAALLSLSLFDRAGGMVATTDAALGAESLWGAFGGRTAAGGVSGWAVAERKGQRLLAVDLPLGSGGALSGLFSLEEADRVAFAMVRNITLYGLLVVGAMTFLGWLLFVRVVVRPMGRLLKVVEKISEGDLSFQFDLEGGNEIGRLSSSLSEMMRRLEADQQRLKGQIEELERLNRDLHQAEQGLIRSEKLASVGHLAAGLAHEVGNPISAILGFVGMLQSEDLPAAEKKDMLKRVETEVERVDKIIRTLLAYSRPGKGEKSAVNPPHAIEEALALLRPQKKFKSVTASVELGPKLPLMMADFDLLRQILVNLLLNALDAVNEKGHIWIRCWSFVKKQEGIVWDGVEREPAFFGLGETHRICLPRNGEKVPPDRPMVVFTVVDDGPGISEENQNRIFDPFFTTKDPGKGTGLGLAICHSGVNAMGGEIWVYSRQGVGTQLAFVLPAQPF
jgi:two-component system, NtrC family, sensor kinase